MVSLNRLGFKATKPLQLDSLILTAQSLGIPGTHLIDLERMKG